MENNIEIIVKATKELREINVVFENAFEHIFEDDFLELKSN